MSQCRSCGATIVWAKTRTGRKMPLDKTPTTDGNIILDEGFVEVITPGTVTNRATYTAHFVTCPDAAAYRGKHRKPTPPTGAPVTIPKFECCYCEKPASNRYREVRGWEELRAAGGANKITGRTETGRFVCEDCIRDIRAGRTPGRSPSMFGG